MPEKLPLGTWKDWQGPDAPPPPELWKRSEILRAVERLNIRRPDRSLVVERTIRYWESMGVIPKGTPAQTGYRYLLYPWWFVDLLYQVCRYEARGVRVEDLPVRMRVEAQLLSRMPWARPKDPHPVPDAELGDFIAHRLGQQLHEPTQPPFSPPAHPASIEFGDLLMAVLNVFVPTLREATIPAAAERVRVQFLDAAGEILGAHEVTLPDLERVRHYLSLHSGDSEMGILLSPLGKITPSC